MLADMVVASKQQNKQIRQQGPTQNARAGIQIDQAQRINELIFPGPGLASSSSSWAFNNTGY